ncbi:MAG: sensor histidine kinase [Lachnospiraceae bacterium]
MDTNLKSSSVKRWVLAIVLVGLIALVNVMVFPYLNRMVRSYVDTSQYLQLYYVSMEYGIISYVASMIMVLLTVIFTTSRHIWTDMTFERKGIFYLAEIAAGCCVFLVLFFEWYLAIMIQFDNWDQVMIPILLVNANLADVKNWLETFVMIFGIFAANYLILYFIRPVFSLGIKEYIKQYSFIYLLIQEAWKCIRCIGRGFRTVGKKWESFVYEIRHIDLRESSTKTILKVVVINFFVLAVLMCLWFFGIAGLLLYSVLLFLLLNRYYEKIAKDYQTLMGVTSRIAKGDFFNLNVKEDLGVFNPFKEELEKIEKGFSKALEEETKSQRMKTELITNVSHDLKTPLTAITTYVELLKKENITEEERQSYIETLEKKSLRLKVLIEDLFEVSKANSGSVQLHMVEVDVVNLMKQVCIEHMDQYEEMGLLLRWNVPKEKVIVKLDSQKTYRIFENLFANVQKYAMPHTRVYLDVKVAGQQVLIVLKNISVEEISVPPEELMERFVRGDAARNTEGSGLGLAIVKSFVELQKGAFSLDVDGDLFKVMLCFPLERIQE